MKQTREETILDTIGITFFIIVYLGLVALMFLLVESETYDAIPFNLPGFMITLLCFIGFVTVWVGLSILTLKHFSVESPEYKEYLEKKKKLKETKTEANSCIIEKQIDIAYHEYKIKKAKRKLAEKRAAL